jgi:hypothetical protein
MNPVGRRSFAKGLGLIGLIGVGVAGYKEAKERLMPAPDELASKELSDKLDKQSLLTLNATYGEQIPPPAFIPYGQFAYIGTGPNYKPGTEIRVQAKMQVGPDGKLYVKENDIWRKI